MPITRCHQLLQVLEKFSKLTLLKGKRMRSSQLADQVSNERARSLSHQQSCPSCLPFLLPTGFFSSNIQQTTSNPSTIQFVSSNHKQTTNQVPAAASQAIRHPFFTYTKALSAFTDPACPHKIPQSSVQQQPVVGSSSWQLASSRCGCLMWCVINCLVFLSLLVPAACYLWLAEFIHRQHSCCC